MENEVDVSTLPWAQDILAQAQALTGTGIDTGTAVMFAIGVPIVLKVLQMATPFVETRAKDVQGKIHIAKLEQMAQLREKHGPDVFNEVVEAIDRQEQAAIGLRAAGVKAKGK